MNKQPNQKIRAPTPNDGAFPNRAMKREGIQPDLCAHKHKIRKVLAAGHEAVVQGAPKSDALTSLLDAFENANVGAVRAGVLVVQELARVLLAQPNAAVQRRVLKRGKCHGICGLVCVVDRIGFRHVLVAVEVPVFGHHDPFAAASDDRAPGMGRSSSWHCIVSAVCICIVCIMCIIYTCFNFQFFAKCESQNQYK